MKINVILYDMMTTFLLRNTVDINIVILFDNSDKNKMTFVSTVFKRKVNSVLQERCKTTSECDRSIGEKFIVRVYALQRIAMTKL